MSIVLDRDAAISLDRDLSRRLASLSGRSGRSPEELIHDAVVAYLDARERYRLPSWVGAWTGDAPNGSVP
jgi:predicted transcriptional regulator